jgi:hypothetical protein
MTNICVKAACYLSIGSTLILVILKYGTRSINVQDSFVVLCCSVVFLLSTANDSQKGVIEGKLVDLSQENSPVNFKTVIILRYLVGIVVLTGCLFRLLM